MCVTAIKKKLRISEGRKQKRYKFATTCTNNEFKKKKLITIYLILTRRRALLFRTTEPERRSGRFGWVCRGYNLVPTAKTVLLLIRFFFWFFRLRQPVDLRLRFALVQGLAEGTAAQGRRRHHSEKTHPLPHGRRTQVCMDFTFCSALFRHLLLLVSYRFFFCSLWQLIQSFFKIKINSIAFTLVKRRDRFSFGLVCSEIGVVE